MEGLCEFTYLCVNVQLVSSSPVSSIGITGPMDDLTMEADAEECGLSAGEPGEQREEPLGSVNGKPETDDKENNNGMSTDEIQAVRYDVRKYHDTHLLIQN